MLEPGRRPCSVGGREEEGRSGGPGGEKSDSWPPPRAELSWGLQKDGDPQNARVRVDAGGFRPSSSLGFAQTSWPISPQQQGAVCHIWAETTLNSKGMQKTGAGSLEVPTDRGGQAPQLRLRP